MQRNNAFSFEISLSILNHLGRNLYRSFATVLWEAISNSWDADAKNVWLYIDKENGSFFLKDDGIGMDEKDFQDKFLKIGYSKRKDGGMKSPGGRPYIGRKGIGKLALLSCAERVTVISKKEGSDYAGGTIDNAWLDKAITDDLAPTEYKLAPWDDSIFEPYVSEHIQGTIIHFEGVQWGITNSLETLKKMIALCFRFSLIDSDFSIYLNGEQVTIDCLKDLADATQFLWIINRSSDSYVSESNIPNLKERKVLTAGLDFSGFIGSVSKPRDLKIMNVDERVGVDLFVNGRLREKNVLKYIPTSQVAESYLYGQLHFDSLDTADVDRFTSSREWVVADDPKYLEFQGVLKKIILTITNEWDKLRIKHKEDGDAENTENMSKKQRKSSELFNAVAQEYSSDGSNQKEDAEKWASSAKKHEIDQWVDELSEDARYNFLSYAECFISENLIRKYILNKKIPLTKEAIGEIAKYKKKEEENKARWNISIEIRRNPEDSSYLSMDDLANLVNKEPDHTKASLSRDAKEYKPMRDAVAHTALLSDEAKLRLTAAYQNIKWRLRSLFFGS